VGEGFVGETIVGDAGEAALGGGVGRLGHAGVLAAGKGGCWFGKSWCADRDPEIEMCALPQQRRINTFIARGLVDGHEQTLPATE
jgi:hypothetical protein